MKGRLRKIAVISWSLANLVLLGFVAHIFLLLPDVQKLADENPATSAFLEYRLSEAADNGKSLKIQRKWVAFKSIPRLLRRTIVVAEDASFWTHNGVDWYEIEAALRDFHEKGKRLRGASTITQQTAKNLYFTPDRNFYRKIRELVVARDLEKHLTKSRILELYLNYIEFGEGVFGISSASNYYFKKSPAELDIFEMVRLAAIIPNPLELNPLKPTGGLKWRCRVILKRIHHYQWISDDQFRAAENEMNRFFR